MKRLCSSTDLAHDRLAGCGQVRRVPLSSGAAAGGLCASKELALNGARPAPPVSGAFPSSMAARVRALCASLFLSALLTSPWLVANASAQVAEKANEGYKTKEGRAGVAKTLADPKRDERQKPRELVDALGLRPGNTVVDLGTGVGYMLPFLSHAVGPTGRVLGEDIQSDFLDQARTRARTLGLNNVTFILGADRDPKLPADTADVVLVLDVYHHFDYPETMLGHIRDCLLSDGRLVIVDYYKREEAMPNGRALEHIRLDEDDVIKEVEANGFRLLSQHEHLPKTQYMAIFVKN